MDRVCSISICISTILLVNCLTLGKHKKFKGFDEGNLITIGFGVSTIKTKDGTVIWSASDKYGINSIRNMR